MSFNVQLRNPGSGFNVALQSGPAAVPGYPRVWTGSEWAYKPVKVWTGSAWVQKPLRYWNGSAWVPAPAAAGFSDSFDYTGDIAATGNYVTDVSQLHAFNGYMRNSDGNANCVVRITAAAAQLADCVWTSTLRFRSSNTYLSDLYFYVRWVDENNHTYFKLNDAGECEIYERISGTYYERANTVRTLPAINTAFDVVITVTGASISVVLNNQSPVSFGSMTGNLTATGKRYGSLASGGTLPCEVDYWSIV